MTDIFDEVEEDLRRERLAKVWERYGIYVILVAVLIVVVTAGWRGYEWWRVSSERSAGDQYVALLSETDAAPDLTPDALAAFADDAPGGFAILARFRTATAFDEAGEPALAVETLRTVANDSGAPSLYRDMAQVRLAQLLLDEGDNAAAQEAVVALAEDAGNPFNRSATEMMGLASYAAGELDAAERWYEQLSTNAVTSQAMRQRAETMLQLIDRDRAQAEAQAARDAAFEAQEAAAEAEATASEGEAAPADTSDETPAESAADVEASGETPATAFPMPTGEGTGGSAFPMPTGEGIGTIGTDVPSITPPSSEAAGSSDTSTDEGTEGTD